MTRKIFAFVVCMILICLSMYSVVGAATTGLTISNVVRAARHYTGVDRLSSDEVSQYDANGNGEIDLSDIIKLVKRLTNPITQLQDLPMINAAQCKFYNDDVSDRWGGKYRGYFEIHDSWYSNDESGFGLFNLDRNFDEFHATFFILEGSKSGTIRIYLDDSLAWEQQDINVETPPIELFLPVSGARTMRIVLLSDDLRCAISDTELM